MEVNNRINYIDQLKGIAILLVVLGHFIEHNNGRDNFMWLFIYSFHMPLFMFISGYVMQMSFRIEDIDLKNVIVFINKKVRSLLVPFVSWGIIIPYFFFRSSDVGFDTFLMDFIERWGGGLWFLATLFILSILFLLYRWIMQLIGQKGNMDLIVIILLFLFVVFLYKISSGKIYLEGLRSTVSYFLFYFWGVIVMKYKRLNMILLDNERFFTFCILMFFLLLPSFIDISSLGISQSFNKIILAPFAIFAIFFIIRHIRWYRYIDMMFQYFGRESLSIYVTHNGPFVFLLFVADYLPLSPANNIIWFTISLAISIFICFAMIYLKNVLSISSILAFVFYGKKVKMN